MKDKKGAVPVVGGIALSIPVIIGVVVLVALVLAGTFIFASINKYHIIGGGIIALTIIYMGGAAMAGDLTKEKVLVLFLFIFAGILVIFLPNLPVFEQTSYHYFYDDKVGIITVEIGKASGIIEEAFFETTTATVGQQVKLIEPLELEPPNCPVVGLEQTIWRNGAVYTDWGISLYPERACYTSSQISTSFIPSQDGTYSVSSVITASNGAQWSVQGTNSVVVSASSGGGGGCQLTPYWSLWSTDETIVGGLYQSRVYYGVSSGCELVAEQTEYRTVCNDGYLIDGTTNTIGSGKLTCVSTSGGSGGGGATPTPTGTPSSECKEGESIKEGCPGGTEIRIKVCVNGLMVDTEESCPSGSGSGNNNQSSGDSGGDSGGSGDGGDGGEEYGAYLIWLIIGGIFAFLMVMLVVVILLKRR